MTLSIILAAGRGSRMKGFQKNKTCISLLQDYDYPMILEILKNTFGKKVIVVNYRKEDVMKVTSHIKNIIYSEQPELNGTGGAILSCYEIIKRSEVEHILITMGDVPLVKRSTYLSLIQGLKKEYMMVLGFFTENKRQYGLLEIEGDRVKRIVEWAIWKDFSEKEKMKLNICNSGIYAIRKDVLIKYMPYLKENPHIVIKERDGIPRKIKEYFLTDLVEYLSRDGIGVGYSIADEDEVVGVDDIDSLSYARKLFLSKRA